MGTEVSKAEFVRLTAPGRCCCYLNLDQSLVINMTGCCATVAPNYVTWDLPSGGCKHANAGYVDVGSPHKPPPQTPPPSLTTPSLDPQLTQIFRGSSTLAMLSLTAVIQLSNDDMNDQPAASYMPSSYSATHEIMMYDYKNSNNSNLNKYQQTYQQT